MDANRKKDKFGGGNDKFPCQLAVVCPGIFLTARVSQLLAPIDHR